MTSIEVLTQARQRSIDPSLVLRNTVNIEANQAALFDAVTPAETLLVPNYLGHPAGGAEFVLPSVKLVSPLQNEARIVDMTGTDKQLARFYRDSVKGAKGGKRMIDDKTFEATIRIMDSNGADGLHHIHDTIFPHTIYFNAKRGNGVLVNVYLTEVGRMKTTGQDSVPVFGFLTATRDKASEYKFFNVIGAGRQKGKYTN